MASPEHRYLRWAVGGAVALLLGCSGLAACWIIPSNGSPSKTPTRSTPSPSSSVSVELSPSAQPSLSPEASEEPYFDTCAEARKAGVPLPIRSNEPGYGRWLDGDNDGKACE